MRYIGMDVHRDFCEVAIHEDGQTRSVGQVKTAPEALKLLTESLDRMTKSRSRRPATR